MESIRKYIRDVSNGLILKAVLIFLFSTAIAISLFYTVSRQIALPESYGRAIGIISLYKLQIVRNGFYIYVFYAVFVLVGVVVISWLYSHKIALPFERIKSLANEMAEGKFDVEIGSDENSDIHPLLDAIDNMARACKGRSEYLRRGIEVIAREARLLEIALKNGDREEFERARRSLSAKASEVEKALSEIRL